MDTLNQYIQLNRSIRSIIQKTYDAIFAVEEEGSSSAATPMIKYIKDDLMFLQRLWPKSSGGIFSLEYEYFLYKEPEDTIEHLQSIIDKAIPKIIHELDDIYISLKADTESYGLEGLIHPIIIRSSYRQYREGLYRDAVLNAIVAVFDFIRERTGLSEDGIQLVGRAFSIDNPVLILSSLDTNSGQNEQKGFIQILQGAYIGIRNPKAHSLSMNRTQDSAAQYLVFASLLARRIEDSRVIKTKQKSKPKTMIKTKIKTKQKSKPKTKSKPKIT